MARTKEERLAEIHKQALDEFDAVYKACSEERLQCLEDRRFYSVAGAQWEGPLGDQFENKPRLEFNKVHLSVIRVVNEYRNNRITVDFTPKDGETGADLADTCDGLYRADEQDSGAQEAYDNAFEEGVGGGFGAARVRACYEDEYDDENERQRLRIEPIFDADTSVFFNLDAKRQDKSDARRCWVLTSMTPQGFEEEFGHDPLSWPKPLGNWSFDWCTPDVVYVAEFYRVEETKEVVHIFRGLDDVEMRVPQHEFDEDEEKMAELLAMGFREVRQKRITKRRVHKYILSGAGVEEDCGYLPGKCIPIVPFYGKRWYVDNIERCMGHVRLAKDAQRLMNSLLSWLTEMAGKFDMEKPIVTPEQILGHATMWAQDNIARYPYLLLNPMKDLDGNPMPAGPLAYTKAPNVPPAMAALIQIAGQALDDLLGNQQAGEQLQPNLSGKAVELIQQRLDMQVFIYMSNLAKFMKRIGEVWLSMAKEVMPEDERKAKTVAADGAVSSVVLRQPMVNEKTGEEYLANNLDEASFDVWVDVGPASSSRKSAAVRALTGMASITADPQEKSILTAAALAQMDGEGIADVKEFFRKKLVRMGVSKPTDADLEEMQREQAGSAPDPQAQYLLAAAKQAEADAALGNAKTVDTIAAAELKRAKTAETLAGIDGQKHSQALDTMQALHRVMSPPGGPGQR